MLLRFAPLVIASALSLSCAGAQGVSRANDETERPRPSATSGGREASAEPQPLTYREYTLGSPAPDALLVALHYSGSTPEFWDELLHAWDEPVRVVLPRGPWPRRQGFTWVPADHEQKSATEKTADVEREAARIAQLIRDIRRERPEIRRVAVTGISYGGDLSWMLAARYPGLVDVAVPIGSRLLGDPIPSQRTTTRVLVLQGAEDAIIDARQTAGRVDHLSTRGVAIELRSYADVGHDFSADMKAHWRVFLHDWLRGTTDSEDPPPG